MPLPVPNLDNRRFQDLVNEAKRLIPRYCVDWTDHNVSDPGVTLIELFAWMTEQYIYRLNQVPDKNFITFLNLMGAGLEPAVPARGAVTFTLASEPTSERRIIIPAATEVATKRTETEEAVVFTTDYEVEALVADPLWLLTGRLTDKSEEEHEDQSEAWRREARFPIWQNPAASGDALYAGFNADLSAHTLALGVSCNPGTNFTPSNPAWVWEAWCGEDEKWERAHVARDTTEGMQHAGEIRLLLPYGCQPKRIARREARTWVRCRPMDPPLPPGMNPYKGPPELLTMNAYTIGITVPVTHARPVGPEVLGFSNGQPGQRFRLQNEKVLPLDGPEEVVQVAMEDGSWEDWEVRPDFGDSGPSALHCTFDRIAGAVEFGPAVRQRNGTEKQFGAIPPRGRAIRIQRYRVGGGVGGNVAAERVVVLKSTVPYVMTDVINRSPITGGLDEQGLEDAKLRAPSVLRTRDRAVTAEDFEHLALQVEGVGRVRCLPPKPADADGAGSAVDYADAPPPGTVRLLVIPSMPPLTETELNDMVLLHESMKLDKLKLDVEEQIQNQLALPEATKNRLRAFLDGRRLLTTRLEILQPDYIWVMVQTKIKTAPKADPGRVQSEVAMALYHFLHPLFGGLDGKGWPFAQPVTPDKVYSRIIETVSGVEYATELKLYPITIKSPDGKRWEQSASIIPSPPNGVVVSYYHNVTVLK